MTFFVRKRSLSLWFSIASSVTFVLIQPFYLVLVNIFSAFLAPLVDIAVAGFYFVITVWAIVFFFSWRKNNLKEAITPIIVQLAAFILVSLVPFGDIAVNLDFKLKFSDRMKVVQMIETGELKPNLARDQSLILLPAEYSSLSDGGEIIVERENGVTKVFFYTVRGMRDNFSGFIFRSDALKPSNEDFDGDFKRIEKFRDHWFYAVSY